MAETVKPKTHKVPTEHGWLILDDKQYREWKRYVNERAEELKTGWKLEMAQKLGAR